MVEKKQSLFNNDDTNDMLNDDDSFNADDPFI